MNIQDRIINVLVEAKLGLLDESHFELAQLMEDRDILLEMERSKQGGFKGVNPRKAAKVAARKAALSPGQEVSGLHAPVTPKDVKAGRRPLRPGSQQYRAQQQSRGRSDAAHQRHMDELDQDFRSSVRVGRR